MKKKWTLAGFSMMVIIIIILSYQLYVAHTILNIQEQRNLVAIEEIFDQLSYRTEQLLREWDKEDSVAPTLLYNRFLKSEGMIRNRLALKFYKVSFMGTHEINYSKLGQFLGLYRATVESDLKKLATGERSTYLKKRVQMISDDMSYLSKYMKREKLNEFSSDSEFFKYINDVFKKVRNKDATILFGSE